MPKTTLASIRMRNVRARKVAKNGGKPETDGERKLVDWFLREVRDAAHQGAQLTVVVDPHTNGEAGANVFFSRSTEGWSADVADLRKARRVRPVTR
jgi:hypothetical protein